MSVALTENVEQYLIALPYPKDISDNIAWAVLNKVERSQKNSDKLLFALYLTSTTDGQDYNISISATYDLFGDDRLVIHIDAMAI